MKRKITYMMAMFLLLFSFVEIHAAAQGKVTTSEELYIVFVVDHSGSMNSRDGEKLISEGLKAFVDTMQNEKVQIGYVAYNDKIIISQSPVSVQIGEQCTRLKELIDSSPNGGETDIGLGISEACRMLEGVQGKRMIVLISDGETDLENSTTGRTKEDSDKDIQKTIQKCVEEDIQISTIAFGEEYGADAEELYDLSLKTNGKNFLLQEPDGLLRILCDLFYSGASYSVYEAGNSIYDEGSQKISYESADCFEELNILFLSDKEIENIDILWDGRTENMKQTEQIKPVIEGKYAIAGFRNINGKFSISFDTEQKQKMTVFVIGRRSILPVIEWKEEPDKNRLIEFQITFEYENGDAVESLNYDSNTWEAAFENVQTGEIVQLEIIENAQGLSGTVNFESSGEYILYLKSQDILHSIYTISGINILNTLPASTSSKEIELLTVSGEQAIDLNEYFVDADGDALSYELQEAPEEIVKAELKETTLLLEPKGRGRGEIKLLISDGEGSLIGTIPVRTKYFLEAYWQIVVGIVCVLVFCIIKFYRRKREIPVPEKLEAKTEYSFTGKLNAYFTVLPDGFDEIPPLTFALHPVREKKIALSSMFSAYPNIIDLLMLDNVYLFPAEHRKIILYQDSDAAVMIGNSIVCRRMQYIVSYGNVIYITSKDGSCELEVHYISMI